MKKITKILSGTLLVALMSFGLATKLNARNDVRLEARDVLTEDFTKSVTGKVVRRAGNEEAQNKISAAKAQIADAGEGKRHIRFVVGLDSVRYADAKFDIVAKNGDTVVKTFADQKVTTAYTHIEAAGVVQSAAQVFGLEYNYLVAFTVNNVPQAAWDYKFEITASVKTEEDAEWTTSEVAEKVITKIAEADEEIDAPDFDLQGGSAGGEKDAFVEENIGKNIVYYNEGCFAGKYYNADAKSLNIGVSKQLSGEGDSAIWYGLQAHAAPSNFLIGGLYEVAFTLNSPVEGKIIVGGEKVDLHIGDNYFNYKVIGVKDKAPLSVIFGTETSSQEELMILQNVDPYVFKDVTIRKFNFEDIKISENKELTLGNDWNPHGDGFLVFSWSNSELKNNIIVSYKATAIIDGERNSFIVMHNNGDYGKFFRNTKLGGNIGQSNYFLEVEFISIYGVKYVGLFEIYEGKVLTVETAKTRNIEKLNNYLAANDYRKERYTEDNWTLINRLLAEGIDNINNAKTIEEADLAMNNSMRAIDEVEQIKLVNVTISFYRGNELIDSKTIISGEKVGSFPTIQFYEVKGWYTTSTFESGTEVTSDTVVVEDIKLYVNAVAIAQPLEHTGANWNPHGDGYLVFGWTNSNLSNDDIQTYKATAIINGEEVPFEVCHNDGAKAKFFRNTTLGTGINEANYTLLLEFVTYDGVVYTATINVVNGKKA